MYTESGNNELNMTIHDMEFGRRNVGILGTCFNIFKCFIGIGLLAIPSAFSEVSNQLVRVVRSGSWVVLSASSLLGSLTTTR